MGMIPVYLFTGFLDAGKTRFIQETLEDERFNKGERTLLLLCEEGEEEYDPSRFSGKNVYIEIIDDPSDLNPQRLGKAAQAHRCERVMVEYNGMWMLDDLYNGMPENWGVAQEFFFADANTIMTYNANMRNLVADKLKSCELVVFNRFAPGTDQMPYHQLVRTFTRRADIAYEAPDGAVAYDEIEDPLPFDRDAPVIEIPIDAYALWYRDMTEEPAVYNGKTVKVVGRIGGKTGLGGGEFTFGREIMTCCIEDLQFAGLVCRMADRSAPRPEKGQWVAVKAKISIKKPSIYKRPGPVLTVEAWKPVPEPEEPIATFF